MNSDLLLAHVVNIATGIGVQALGTYALWLAFGAWITCGLYAVGGLAAALVLLIIHRSAPC